MSRFSDLPPVLQNLDEGAGAQFVGREPAQARGLRLGESAAVDRAQEVVEQTLTRRRVVEHVADERGARGLLDKVAQTLRGRPEAFEEEGVDGRVARRQLRRVQVPALIEGV